MHFCGTTSIKCWRWPISGPAWRLPHLVGALVHSVVRVEQKSTIVLDAVGDRGAHREPHAGAEPVVPDGDVLGRRALPVCFREDVT
jgi:hypothetical protein